MKTAAAISIIAVLFYSHTGIAQTTRPTPDEVEWDLGGNLKGNAAQVAHQLNGATEDAWAHLADQQSGIKIEQADLDAETAAVLRSVHSSQAYKQQLIEEASADKALQAARDAGDNGAALDIGGRANIAKAAMSDMDRHALADDAQIIKTKAFVVDYTQRITAAQAALSKTAKWRARIMHGLRNSFLMRWPVVIGEETLLSDGKVTAIAGGHLTLKVVAIEEMPDTVKKNAGGDGLDVATFREHPVRLVISLPADVHAVMGGQLAIKRVYKITENIASIGDSRTYRAKADDDGNLGTLFRRLNDVHGPPQTYLDLISKEVDAEETRSLAAMDKAPVDK